MRSPRTKQQLSKTYFYELLDVPKTATTAEIKKAYRKKALQCHPDKGGDRELFEKCKYASDILTDSYKRSIYDQYGELGVKILDKNFSMDSAEMALQLFLSIGPCERLMLILLLTLLIGYFLLFPILLSVRWDHPRALSFTHVFMPVWFGLTLVLSFCFCCVQAPAPPDMDGESEEHRKEQEDQQAQRVSDARKLKWGTAAVILVLSAVMTLLVLRLDGEVKCSYFLVIWPWILLELGQFAYKFYSAEAYFLWTGQNPEILTQQKWLTKDWLFFVTSFTCSHIFNIAFACLLASKMDGMKLTWWEVFSPYWVLYVLHVVLALGKCGRLKTEEDLEGMAPETRARQDTVGTVIAAIILNTIWLGCVVLLCWKLDHHSAFPAWVIFLPLFVISGCLCCCLSCVLCCMSPDLMNVDEEAGGGSSMAAGAKSPAQPMYGSM